MDTLGLTNSLFSSRGVLAWAITYLSSISAEKYSISSDTKGTIRTSGTPELTIASAIFCVIGSAVDPINSPVSGLIKSSRKVRPTRRGSSGLSDLMTHLYGVSINP